MATVQDVHENVKKYYGSQLGSSCDLQTSAATCNRPSAMPQSVREALSLVHPEVIKKFFGCGLPFPAKLEECRVLDLGSGSGRDCFAFSKLVGPNGHVTGIDMTEEMITVSQQYIPYHQERCGYSKPNVTFLQGYMEKLREAGLQNDSNDVVLSNCVICLCPDKLSVLKEAYKVLKEGGELYFSDMYASKPVPDHMTQDPVLWGEGMAGALYWQDFISLALSVGFSAPYLVSASHIVVYNDELRVKTGDVQYASATYRLFKLPNNPVCAEAEVTYKGTIEEFKDQLNFDSSHCFKKDVPTKVNGEMALILQSSRFSPDFKIEVLDTPNTCSRLSLQYCHLNPFLLAEKLGSSVK
ncbi:arsenite methyltransferase [Eucyclogobius newberryi]|uniref:arsenite methyltransferase n=1 Tax=Eucyclogobius newberryi TaxID=166745 RepID=UPI003B5A3336